MTIYKDAKRTYQVGLSKPMRASLFIDQYSGEIRGHAQRPAFFATMFRLHRWLLDSANPNGDGPKIGKRIVGISTIIFVVVLITGVVLWWPRARKGLRRSLAIHFSKGLRVFWNGLHVAGGMYVVVIVLAMALTGLTWAFDWYRTAFYAVCGVENTPRGNNNRGGGTRDNTLDFSHWQEAYNELKVANPHSLQISIANGSATVALGNYGNPRATDAYTFDPQTGAVELQTPYAEAKRIDKVRGWISAIHMGAFGGIFTKILWFLAALLGASLPLTGYYIWIKSKRIKSKNDR